MYIKVAGQQMLAEFKNGEVEIMGTCRGTGKSHSVTIPEQSFRTWMTGNANIQNAMPTVSPDDREFLISGYSPEGWALLFPEGEED